MSDTGYNPLSAQSRDLPGRAVYFEDLTAKEQMVAKLYAEGSLYKEIAYDQHIAFSTVASYLKRIKRKYRMHGLNIATRQLLWLQLRREGAINDVLPEPDRAVMLLEKRRGVREST